MTIRTADDGRSLSLGTPDPRPKSIPRTRRDGIDLGSVIDWIRERYDAEQRRDDPRCWGLSSDALMWAAIDADPTPPYAPSDPPDLLACELTCLMGPSELRPAMEKWLRLWRDEVYERYPRSRLEVDEAIRRWRVRRAALAERGEGPNGPE